MTPPPRRFWAPPAVLDPLPPLELQSEDPVYQGIMHVAAYALHPKRAWATPCHTALVSLPGISGTEADNTRDRGEPFEFKVGEGEVIKGLDMLVATMRKGEQCSALVAPQYGYGEEGEPFACDAAVSGPNWCLSERESCSKAYFSLPPASSPCCTPKRPHFTGLWARWSLSGGGSNCQGCSRREGTSEAAPEGIR